MTSPINRPHSAPLTTNLKINHKTNEVDRCSICYMKIFGGAFAEISNEPFSKMREPICSTKCFEVYIRLHDKYDPVEPPPVSKNTIPLKQSPKPESSAKDAKTIAKVNAAIKKTSTLIEYL